VACTATGPAAYSAHPLPGLLVNGRPGG
jgi:hypothetical protein